MARHLLVGNPTAQSGRNAERIEQAQSFLAEHDVATDLLATEPAGGTVGAVRKALDGGSYDCVIAMGGDGTFREVATGLLECSRTDEVAMGMLPTGTANDQGRSFGLSAHEDDLIDNAAIIAEGRETKLDAGNIKAYDSAGDMVLHTWFFDSAGWGMSARTLAVRNRDREWVAQTPILGEIYRDHLLYAGALLKTFIESYVVPDKFAASVVADGIKYELEGLTDLIVKNTRIYAGAWVFDHRSRHDDGVFEVVPFRGRSDWLSKGMVDLEGNLVTEEMLNTVGIEHSKPLRGGHIELTLTPTLGGAGLAAQIDGEEFPPIETVVIDVVQRAVRLIVP